MGIMSMGIYIECGHLEAVVLGTKFEKCVEGGEHSPHFL
jgi:hypothetical protein